MDKKFPQAVPGMDYLAEVLLGLLIAIRDEAFCPAVSKTIDDQLNRICPGEYEILDKAIEPFRQKPQQ